jgi:aspartyl-tRNA(Asn)/glutamyl-tRNA(Gln) amidotransferase subunit A
MAAARAGASSPSPSSLDQAGPDRAHGRGRRDDAEVHGRSRPEGFDFGDAAGAGLRRRGATGDIKGLKVGIPKEYRVDGMPEEIEKLWQQGMDWLKAAGAEPSRSRCRTPSTRCRPTTSSRRPRLVEPGALRRRALRPARAGQDT